MWIGSQEISQRFKGEACTAQYYWYQSILVGWEHHDFSSNAQPVNLQRERAVGEQHQKRTDRLREISPLKYFYDTGSRGMSSTAGLKNPSGTALLISPTLKAQEKTLKCLNAGKPWRKSKSFFNCCLGIKEKKKQKDHSTFHAKLRGFSSPSGHKKYFILHQKHH